MNNCILEKKTSKPGKYRNLRGFCYKTEKKVIEFDDKKSVVIPTFLSSKIKCSIYISIKNHNFLFTKSYLIINNKHAQDHAYSGFNQRNKVPGY